MSGPERRNQRLRDMGFSRRIDVELLVLLEVEDPKREGRTVGDAELTHLVPDVSVQIMLVEQRCCTQRGRRAVRPDHAEANAWMATEGLCHLDSLLGAISLDRPTVPRSGTPPRQEPGPCRVSWSSRRRRALRWSGRRDWRPQEARLVGRCMDRGRHEDQVGDLVDHGKGEEALLDADLRQAAVDEGLERLGDVVSSLQREPSLETLASQCESNDSGLVVPIQSRLDFPRIKDVV
jgi:hypothetical protein